MMMKVNWRKCRRADVYPVTIKVRRKKISSLL
jgi:hypothetical protein